MSDLALSPPEVTALTAPEPVAEVTAEQTSSYVKLTSEQKTQLDVKVKDFVSTLLDVEVMSPAFKEKLDSVYTMGDKEMNEAASVSSDALKRPTRVMNQLSGGDAIGKNIIELRSIAESLDPSQRDLFSKKKLLGFIPFGNQLDAYFKEFQSNETHIAKIIQALKNGEDQLLKDNAAIDNEKFNMWNVMVRLEQYIYIGREIDKELVSQIEKIRLQSPEKARVIEVELLYAVRQKVIRWLEASAACIQSYLVKDMNRKINYDYAMGIKSATTTLRIVLNNAVEAAEYLGNTRLVMSQCNAVYGAIDNIMNNTSKMLEMTVNEVVNNSAKSNFSLEKLNDSFARLYSAFDTLDNYKVQAVGNMEKTIAALSGHIEKSKSYTERVRQQEISTFDATVSVVL